MKELRLKLPAREGGATVWIGDDCLESRLPSLTNGQKNFVLTDSNVYALYGDFFARYFADAELFVLKAGEESKNFQSLQAILEKMTAARLHRDSRLFAVGGGVVGDIGGLAAALYMRGIACTQIPTTLLSQADSSVGGKTAVDLGGVKNVVGAFYQPEEVLIAPRFLRTLPPREIKCGVGEIVKYAALNGDVFDCLEGNVASLGNVDFLLELLEICVRHKAEVVERDERESGERKSLNVGHTTGHALELASGLSHGESVLYGMLLETELAVESGVCERAYGERLLEIVRGALEIEPKAKLDFSALGDWTALALADKKNADDGRVTLAIAKAKGEWTLLSLPYNEYAAAMDVIVKRL